MKDSLPRDHYRLYKLIWDRFLACQMETQVLDVVAVDVLAKGRETRCLFKACLLYTSHVGYDYAVPGNHEFDYGMDVFLDLAQNRAQYTYLSCNFLGQTGDAVLSPYALEDYGDVQVAYLGISTPETLTTVSYTHLDVYKRQGEGKKSAAIG